MTVDRSSPGSDVVHRRFRAMSTGVHVVVVGGPPEVSERIERLVADRHARWTRFDADSELSAVNRSGGRPVRVTAETFDVICQAIDAVALTDGAFDPTVGRALIDAGYDRDFELVAAGLAGLPDDRPSAVVTAWASEAAPPGWAAIELHHGTGSVVVPPGVVLDLGGIAKGVTADQGVALALALGAEGCCVNIGGDLRVAGRAPSTDGWTVTLDCPGSPETRAVALVDGAVCTSSTVRRRWTGRDGSAHHHLRRPSTGCSLDTGLLTATVISARAAQAEVLTKAVLAAGPDGAAAITEARGATGLVVDRTGAIRALPGLDPFLLHGTSSC